MIDENRLRRILKSTGSSDYGAGPGHEQSKIVLILLRDGTSTFDEILQIVSKSSDPDKIADLFLFTAKVDPQSAVDWLEFAAEQLYKTSVEAPTPLRQGIVLGIFRTLKHFDKLHGKSEERHAIEKFFDHARKHIGKVNFLGHEYFRFGTMQAEYRATLEREVKEFTKLKGIVSTRWIGLLMREIAVALDNGQLISPFGSIIIDAITKAWFLDLKVQEKIKAMCPPKVHCFKYTTIESQVDAFVLVLGQNEEQASAVLKQWFNDVAPQVKVSIPDLFATSRAVRLP